MQADKLFQEGQELHQKGNLREALYRYERALKLQPNNSKCRIFYAVILQQLGQPQDAAVEAQRALSDMNKPDISVLVNYGVILKNVGRFNDAATAYERALEINPGLHSAKANLGTIYLLQGKLDQAESIFTEIVSSSSDPGVLLNLSRILILKSKYEEAKERLQQASDLDPTHPDLCLLSGRLAHLDKDEEKAYEWAIKGLKKAPASRDLWVMLQAIKNEVYKIEEVEALLIKLAGIKVQSVTTLSVAVDLCRKNWIWGPLASFEKMLSQALKVSIDKIPTASDVFTMLGANIPQSAHKEIAIKCWQGLTQTPPLNQEPHELKWPLQRKLRVGFLSSDLRGHAIGYLIVGLFDKLPKERVEWWAYSNSLDDGSDVLERVKKNFDRKVNIFRLTDLELAEKIREDGIDVLIDLNQMTAMTRASVMHHRPAPIQIQWLGMPGTLGAGSSVDYVVVDPWVVNEKNADGFSECLLSLPRSYQPNDHISPDLSLCESREAAGLPKDGVIFGVFNQHYKFSPDTFALWGQIMRAVKDSYIWLLAPKSVELQDRIVLHAQQNGIDKSRLIFAPHKKQSDHLARLQWMDLVLDTWPYNAHTTCSDALRAGVPVLTYPHETFASRVAYGILETAKMSEWIAHSPEEYVNKAIEFGLKTRAQIEAQKKEILQRYWASEMVNNNHLAVMFESMLLGLYERAAGGMAPTSLQLTESLVLIPLSYGRQENNPNNAGAEKSLTDINLASRGLNTNASERNSDTKEFEGWKKQIKRGEKNSRLSNLRILQTQVLALTAPPLALEVAAEPLEVRGQVTLASSGLITNFVIANSGGGEPSSLSEGSRINVLLGDGNIHTFREFQFKGLSSTLRPNSDWLTMFPGFGKWTTVKSERQEKTTRLDDLVLGQAIRFAKLKLNGQEMVVLQNSPNLLEELSFLEIDASPTPMYEGERSFFELGHWLTTQGYLLHTINHEHKSSMVPYAGDDNPHAAKHQIIRLSAVFMPNPLSWPSLSEDRLIALAFLAQAVYRSPDIATKALFVLDQRDAGDRVENFKEYLELASLDA